jgi:hypothetical protein
LYGAGGGVNADGLAAAAVREANPSTVDLSFSGCATQLPDQLDDLRDPGGPEGVALTQQTAAGVDRQPAADVRVTPGDGVEVLTAGEEACTLDPQNFRDREAVVHLGDGDILGPDPGALVRLGRC